jgi:hypothetical protein
MPPASIIIKRVLISLVIGLVIGILLNEVTFYFLRETARAPQTVELLIPAGTAKRIAQGEQPPSIPDNMTFVVGDKLLVINQDAEDHQLGPLWIPAGASASLTLDAVQSYAYECSFQKENYFGLDVYEPLTVWTRVYGILFSGIPLGGVIALYSIIMPFKEKQKNVPA